MWFWLLEEADGIVFLTANLTVSMVDPGALMQPAATELADLCDSTGIAPPPPPPPPPGGAKPAHVPQSDKTPLNNFPIISFLCDSRMTPPLPSPESSYSNKYRDRRSVIVVFFRYCGNTRCDSRCHRLLPCLPYSFSPSLPCPLLPSSLRLKREEELSPYGERARRTLHVSISNENEESGENLATFVH